MSRFALAVSSSAQAPVFLAAKMDWIQSTQTFETAQIQSICRHLSLRSIDRRPLQFHVPAGKNHADSRIPPSFQPQFQEPVLPQ